MYTIKGWAGQRIGTLEYSYIEALAEVICLCFHKPLFSTFAWYNSTHHMSDTVEWFVVHLPCAFSLFFFFSFFIWIQIVVFETLVWLQPFLFKIYKINFKILLFFLYFFLVIFYVIFFAVSLGMLVIWLRRKFLIMKSWTN